MLIKDSKLKMIDELYMKKVTFYYFNILQVQF